LGAIFPIGWGGFFCGLRSGAGYPRIARSWTLLFGQSGLGKTSLLHAGLFPHLRSDRYLPVSIRLEFSSGAAELAEQVKLRIQQVISESGLEDSALPRENETLWEYFHRRGYPLRGQDGVSRVPVLVFDQFEEIFTLGEGGRKSRSARFLTELSDLVENRPPKEIEECLEADLNAADSYEFGKADYRILLSLREDYLAHLEDLRVLMPSLSQNRIRLNAMSDRKAIDAVLGPGGDLVTLSLAEDIGGNFARRKLSRRLLGFYWLRRSPRLLGRFSRIGRQSAKQRARSTQRKLLFGRKNSLSGETNLLGGQLTRRLPMVGLYLRCFGRGGK